jgi:hypothetical protein
MEAHYKAGCPAEANPQESLWDSLPAEPWASRISPLMPGS